MRIGIGKSSLQFSNNTNLVLGGISIKSGGISDQPSEQDKLLLSVCDALLGAAGLGDIYQADEFKDFLSANNTQLISEVEKKVHYNGYQIVNFDIIISTSLPEIQSHIRNIRDNITSLLFIKPEQMNIKLNSINNEPAAQCQQHLECLTIVLLKKRS